MATITGIHHVYVRLARVDQMLGNQERRTRLCMAHHKHVGMHRRQIVDGIEQGLALAGAGS